MTCNFLKNLLLYSGCEIPQGLKYAISKYGNIRKRYISLLLLPGLMEERMGVTLAIEWYVNRLILLGYA